MRIVAAPDGHAVDRDHVDQMDQGRVDLSCTTLYTEGDAHRWWRVLRAERPVFWNQSSSRPGFWSVTRHADVRQVLRDHTTFTSERGTSIDTMGGRDLAAGRMMHATDPPCHRRLRVPIERPLTSRAMAAHTDLVRSAVERLLAPAREETEWDAAGPLTQLPMEVVAGLMALPPGDADTLLRLAYASVAPGDPHYRHGSVPQTLKWAHSEIVDYFHQRVRERRRRPGDDLLSHLVTMEVGGQQLPDEAVVLNCFSMLVGGVVTTGQVVCATLVALAERGGGEGRWPEPDPGPPFVEEALRWASPTTHFLRYTRQEVTLAGVTIPPDQPVAAWIASANRDERIFGRPYTFDASRIPNRHLAFGAGPHRCVGRQVARVMLREGFSALRSMTGSFELAAEPTHLASTLIAGVVRLPIRSRPRRNGPADTPVPVGAGRPHPSSAHGSTATIRSSAE